MRKSLLLLIILGTPINSVQAEPVRGCSTARDVRGVASAIRKIRFVIIGETHGTVETPAFVGDLACEILQVRPMTVAFEFPSTAAVALNRYLTSDGRSHARQALLASPIWLRSTADGRSSKAMFALIERLRELRTAGARIRLAAFQPSDIAGLDQHYYELAMASAWAGIADEAPENLNLILVGQVHARKHPSPQYSFAPAASHLKAADVLSLRSEPTGGEAWNCQQDGCKVHALPGKAISERYVTRFASEIDGFDGAYSVGKRYSSSDPKLPN